LCTAARFGENFDGERWGTEGGKLPKTKNVEKYRRPLKIRTTSYLFYLKKKEKLNTLPMLSIRLLFL
jgi:hypothetical protein